MKKFIITLTALFYTLQYNAQKIEWAYKVLEHSSEKGVKNFSSKQVIGRPNVIPASGENEKAWQPSGENKEEYIKVMFLNPMKPKYIVIAESWHPGMIKQVIAYDLDGKAHEIKTFEPKRIPENKRVLNIPTPDINYFVSAVKVVVSTEKNTPVGIDAIGISNDKKPFEVIVNESDVIQPNMVAKKLNKNVNSIHPEMGPLISPDGKRLYFSRIGDPANNGGPKDVEDIWYCDWDSVKNDWGKAKNMGEPFNNKAANYINSISPDGNTMLLGNKYMKDGDMEQGVSISYKTATGWTPPKNLTIENFKNISENTDFYLSNSKKYLLMGIEQKGDTKGDRDIYVSFAKNDSVFSKPLNLGMKVNTALTEANPFLASDDKTLYYATNGFAGYGGSDIYMTRRLDDTWQRWSEPENLGTVVNTVDNEMFFSMSASGDKVFFTSGNVRDGDLDVLTLNLPKNLKPNPVALVKGKVLDSKTNQPIGGVKVLFEDLKSGKEMGTATSDPNTGEFQIVLPSGANYGYLAEKQGFVSVNANMDLVKLPEYSEVPKDLFLTPIETGASIAINNIFFDSNKAILKKESFLELNRLARVMNENQGMTIEIGGHSDNVGSEESNKKLSLERAEAVARYMGKVVKNDKERITLQAYGESKPIASNDTEEGRAQNRRVEFKILSIEKPIVKQ